MWNILCGSLELSANYSGQPGDGEDLGDRGGELTGSVGERRGYCQRI